MIDRTFYRALGLLLFWSASIHACGLPVGASFIGLTTEGWKVHVTRVEGQCTPVPDLLDVRQVTWAASNERLVIVDAAGAVVEKTLRAEGGSKTLVAADHPNAYTQIRLGEQGRSLWAVQLENRQSERTQLVRYAERSRSFEVWHQQSGAVFDMVPLATGGALYSHVSCVVGCDGIRQELWQRSAGGHARQLTLFNGMARYPVLAGNGDIWFSLSQDVGYGLWRRRSNGQFLQETDTTHSDLWPAVSGDDVFFVRRNEDGGRLMRWRAGTVTEIPVNGITDIRDLEITP